MQFAESPPKQKHSSAVQDLCGCRGGPRGKPVSGAPSAEDFRAVWQSARRGEAPEKGVENIAQARKNKEMRACLAEGIFILDRQHVSDSVI